MRHVNLAIKPTQYAAPTINEKFRIAFLDLQGVLQIEYDFLIYGRTQTEHNERLRVVLQRLRQIGVTLRKEKCQWNQKSVIWFGYKFGSEGMSPDPAKVETIKQLPPPKNTTEVKSFLQMSQYYYMFLFDNEQTYDYTTAPLRAMLQKGAKFVRTKECQQSFECIK